MKHHPGYEKGKRWRQKQIKAGRCPHCGKPCAPFYECDERRNYEKSKKLLNRMVDTGFLKKRREGVFNLYSVDNPNAEMPVTRECRDDDMRYMPRIGKQYINWDELFVRVLKEENKPMSEKDILEKSFEIITRFKRA